LAINCSKGQTILIVSQELMQVGGIDSCGSHADLQKETPEQGPGVF
jgi:hypothetical protein